MSSLSLLTRLIFQLCSQYGLAQKSNTLETIQYWLPEEGIPEHGGQLKFSVENWSREKKTPVLTDLKNKSYLFLLVPCSSLICQFLLCTFPSHLPFYCIVSQVPDKMNQSSSWEVVQVTTNKMGAKFQEGVLPYLLDSAVSVTRGLAMSACAQLRVCTTVCSCLPVFGQSSL